MTDDCYLKKKLLSRDKYNIKLVEGPIKYCFSSGGTTIFFL